MKLVPKRRFKGFSGEWEEQKLGEIADFNPPAVLPHSFQYVDLESVVGTELISYRTEYKKSAPSRAQRLATRGDVFYQTVRPYQKNNYLFDLPRNDFVFSTGYAQMRPSIDSYFLLSRVQSDDFVATVLDRCTGTSFPAISSSSLAEIEIMIPDEKIEQLKVGLFFKKLDDKIVIQRDKLNKLQAMKQAYLHEMFPAEGESVPKRRFAGFTGFWTRRKLSRLCVKFNDGDWIELKDQSDKGVRLIQTGNIGITEYLDRKDNKKWVSLDTFEQLNCKEVLPGDILISRLPEPAGRACIVPPLKTKMITAVDCTIVRTSDDCDNKFLIQYLASKQYFNKVKAALAGGTRLRISRSDLERIDVPIPKTIEEQQKIGTFFRKLDERIAMQEAKVKKLKATKKAYLEEMFI